MRWLLGWLRRLNVKKNRFVVGFFFVVRRKRAVSLLMRPQKIYLSEGPYWALSAWGFLAEIIHVFSYQKKNYRFIDSYIPVLIEQQIILLWQNYGKKDR